MCLKVNWLHKYLYPEKTRKTLHFHPAMTILWPLDFLNLHLKVSIKAPFFVTGQ